MRTTVQAPIARQASRGGFTLIELLVAIAVIAILAGFLLPALRAVRGHARNTQCLNNVQQLGNAFQQYVDDNRQVCPPWIARDFCEPTPRDGGHHGGWWGSIHYLVQVYLPKSERVWECPCDDTEDCTPWDGGHNGADAGDRCRRQCGYLYNNGGGTGGVGRPEEGLSFDYTNRSFGKDLESINEPSRKIATFCWSAHNFWPNGSLQREQWWHSQPPNFRVPVAFVDYHAEIIALLAKKPQTGQYKW